MSDLIKLSDESFSEGLKKFMEDDNKDEWWSKVVEVMKIFGFREYIGTDGIETICAPGYIIDSARKIVALGMAYWNGVEIQEAKNE